MKKCQRIKNFIASDYIDGEATSAIKKEVEAHLAKCDDCREYERLMRKMVVTPLKDSKEMTPPEEVWQNIKGHINKRPPVTVPTGWRERLREIFAVPRPAFAVSMVTALLLIAVVFTGVNMRSRNTLNSYLEDQVEFLAYVDTNGFDSEYMDMGTPIEEYFM